MVRITFLLTSVILVVIVGIGACSKESPTESSTTSLTKFSGDIQTGAPGDTLSIPLEVLVTDKNGKAVSDQWIDFCVIEGDAVLSDTLVVTNEIGKAETTLILGSIEGEIKVEAKLYKTDINTVFTVFSKKLPPSTINILSGNYQTGDPGDILPEKLLVIVKNERNEPVENQDVTFNIVEGKGSLLALRDTTDTNGFAFTILTLGDYYGLTKITASVDTLFSVTFTATALLPIIEIIGGNNQSGDIGEELSQPLQLMIKNKKEVPIEGIIVTFNIFEGSGDLSATIDTTNTIGIAQTILTLGDSIGITYVKASIQIDDTIKTLIFTATVLAPIIKVIGGNRQQGYPEEELKQPLQILVTNNEGKPLQNVKISFQITTGDGFLSVYETQTNSNGKAETYMTLGNIYGTIQITATMSDFNSKVEFFETILPYHIAFVANRGGGRNIFLMNTDGTEQVQLIGAPAGNGNPSWSPDGSKIAFTASRDGNPEIYVMNADGSNQIRLTYDSAIDERPSWSPDGSKIAFSSPRDGDYEIYVMDSDGSNQVRLTYESAGDIQPSWSPDGSKIAFASSRDGDYEIYVMDSDGSNQVRLTYESAGDTQPSWSSDGSKIAFTSSRDGGSEIYVMNADGSNQTNLTNNPASDSSPSWEPILVQ